MATPDKWKTLICAVLSAGLGLVAGPARSDENGGISLNESARVGDLARLESRLKEGADPNIRDQHGRPPLIDAVAAGRLDAARLLLSNGADVNACSTSGRTALIEAVAAGNLNAVRLLVQAGASLNDEERGFGTALETAERAGRKDIAQVLRKAGARSSGHSVGDTVCVRPWRGDGYCGTVESVEGTKYRVKVTEVVGCGDGCLARADCSAGRPVGGADGVAVGDEVTTVAECLTHTGVKP